MHEQPSPSALAVHEELLAVCRELRRAEHRAAVLLARMDADRLHLELGWASLLDYAREALQLTDRQARDLLQIGRSLPRLPELDRAFAEGRLPWTKARELLRVVTPETEVAWVQRACEVSSRVLERQVSGALTGDLPPTHVGDEKDPERVRLVFQAS